MKHITNKEATILLGLHALKGAGRIFSVKFRKRTTGEVRNMVCRFDVSKYLKGRSPAYDFAEKRVMNVFDIQKMGYRNINLDEIFELHINGETYEVEA